MQALTMSAQKIATAIPDFFLRNAEPADCDLILALVKELAEYEKLPHEVVATPAILQESLFGPRPYAEAVIGEYQDQPVAFAIFFHNFSSFKGRPGIYLEDLYVKPALRGKGFGRMLMCYVAKLAVERRCARFEWSVLDWNEPSLQFYHAMGARPMDQWTVQRLDGADLDKLAQEFALK